MEDDDEKIIELANLPAEVVADPEQFAAVVLDLGPNLEIVDEVFPALGVQQEGDLPAGYYARDGEVIFR